MQVPAGTPPRAVRCSNQTRLHDRCVGLPDSSAVRPVPSPRRASAYAPRHRLR